MILILGEIFFTVLKNSLVNLSNWFSVNVKCHRRDYKRGTDNDVDPSIIVPMIVYASYYDTNIRSKHIILTIYELY
jgi:hypothetical protein